MLQWSIKSEVKSLRIWSLRSYCSLSHPEVASLLPLPQYAQSASHDPNLIHPPNINSVTAHFISHRWLTDVDWAPPGLLASAAQAHAGHCHARHVGARSRSHGAREARDILRDRVLDWVTVAVTDSDHVVITVTGHPWHWCLHSSLCLVSSLLESHEKTELWAGGVTTKPRAHFAHTRLVTISLLTTIQTRVTRDSYG